MTPLLPTLSYPLLDPNLQFLPLTPLAQLELGLHGFHPMQNLSKVPPFSKAQFSRL